MARYESSVVINRPLDEVFAFLADKTNDSLWQSGLIESSRTSEGAWSTGSTGRNVARFLGRQIESTWELTEYEENRKAAFKSTSGPMAYEGSWTLDPTPEGTRFSVAFEAELSGFYKLADPIVTRMAGRQTESDLSNLKDLLESRA